MTVGKLFQILITLELKKCCLTVVLTLGLNNLDVCPLVVLPGTLVKILSALVRYWLFMILYTLIKSLLCCLQYKECMH